jgi:D-3-phosphoglycerate dehydrogenase
MDEYRVVIVEPIHNKGLEVLKNVGVKIIQLPPASGESDLLTLISEADALITRGPLKITREILKASPQLKVVGLHGIGYDHIDIEAAREFQKIVFNTPDALTVAVAEMTIALILSLTRRVVSADKAVREGEWNRKYEDLIGFELKDRIIGIIGMGRIGEAVTRRLIPFGVRILYFDIIRKNALERELNIEFAPIDEIIRNSNLITLHIPATPRTRHLIGVKEFEKMKKGTFIINTARGSVIDQRALLESLDSGKISGAALDVFENEPIIPDNPLTKRDNVVLTPHLAASSDASMIRMAKEVCEGVIRVLRGEEPDNRIV